MPTPDNRPEHAELDPNAQLGCNVVFAKMGYYSRSELAVSPESPDFASNLRKLKAELASPTGAEFKFVLMPSHETGGLPTLYFGNSVANHAEIASYDEYDPKPVLDAGYITVRRENGIIRLVVDQESWGIRKTTGDREKNRELVGDQMAFLFRLAGFKERIEVEVFSPGRGSDRRSLRIAQMQEAPKRKRKS